MRSMVLAAAALVVCISPVVAQAPVPDPAHLAEMKKLDWLVGKWEGMATYQMGPDQKSTVTQVETIQSKLGGTLLVIEGLGKVGDKVVHEAFGIVHWDTGTKGLKLSAHLADGRSVVADAKVTNGVLEWSFDTPQGSMRYVIERTEDGGWLEKGFRNRPGGTPVEFFEMKLVKVK